MQNPMIKGCEKLKTIDNLILSIFLFNIESIQILENP